VYISVYAPRQRRKLQGISNTPLCSANKLPLRKHDSSSSALDRTVSGVLDLRPAQSIRSRRVRVAAYACPCVPFTHCFEAQGHFHSLQISSANLLPFSVAYITEPFKALVSQTGSGNFLLLWCYCTTTISSLHFCYTLIFHILSFLTSLSRPARAENCSVTVFYSMQIHTHTLTIIQTARVLNKH